MNGDLLRIVDSIHRDKNIPKEIVFQGIESALVSAARKHFSDDADIAITIDRGTGQIEAQQGGQPIDPVELGRIAAQSAKQVMIQKIREAERDAIFDEYETRRGEIVNGSIQRFEGGALIVNLGKTEGILPRGEQIPGETNHPGGRVRCVVVDVRKSGNRVKIILSRTHVDFVRRLFELEVPEIAERIIEIKAMAREAGYRTKVAVSSIDTKVDCVGACVGVRGSRIKNIVEELGGEKIDIVRWNDSMQVLIPNALKPAEIDDVLLCADLARATVIVREDQLSLAIGRRGQNVRLASRLSGWDIDIVTAEEFQLQLARADRWFSEVPGVGPRIVEKLVEKGYYTFDDLSILEADMLTAVEGIGEKKAEEIIAYATSAAERVEKEEAQRLVREKAEARARAMAEAAAAQAQQEATPPRPLAPEEAAMQIFGQAGLDEPAAPTGDAEPTAAEPAASEEDSTADAGPPQSTGSGAAEPLTDADTAPDDAVPEAETEGAAEVEPEAEAEGAAEAETEAEAEGAAEAETEAETEGAAEVEPEAEAEGAAEVEPEAETEGAAEAETEAEAEGAAEVEPEAGAEGDSAAPAGPDQSAQSPTPEDAPVAGDGPQDETSV